MTVCKDMMYSFSSRCTNKVSGLALSTSKETTSGPSAVDDGSSCGAPNENPVFLYLFYTYSGYEDWRRWST